MMFVDIVFPSFRLFNVTCVRTCALLKGLGPEYAILGYTYRIHTCKCIVLSTESTLQVLDSVAKGIPSKLRSVS